MGPGRGGAARGYSWPAFERGNQAALTHGAASPRMLTPLAEQLEAEVRESAPWVDRPAFAGAVRALAYAEAELVLRRAWHDEHGLVDDEGHPLPGTERLERTEARAARLREVLGLTPKGYASLISTVAGTVGPVDQEALEVLMAEGRRIVQARDLRLAEQSDDPGGAA